ncbi:hypothetical protein BDP27DRAFT_1370999 [Rhodocollybia butyracea]|uniref:Uncharacterized protein n=1 Tax=Rhodocollybia butyracea TaxID=206335 RepID=A0A9P5TYK6_9AGAR|nr:hypothetical protein BDP27DRAFT_1370999 [Rhodocollybia butyracea]
MSPGQHDTIQPTVQLIDPMFCAVQRVLGVRVPLEKRRNNSVQATPVAPGKHKEVAHEYRKEENTSSSSESSHLEAAPMVSSCSCGTTVLRHQSLRMTLVVKQSRTAEEGLERIRSGFHLVFPKKEDLKTTEFVRYFQKRKVQDHRTLSDS